MNSPSFKCKIKHKINDINIDISIETSNGITAIIGPSGAGKSTICNIIAGLITPDAGSISLSGGIFFDTLTCQNLKPEDRGIGYVFQDPLLFPHLSVRKNLIYGMSLGDRTSRIGIITSLLNIEGLMDRKPATLSGGEKKRVAIARAVLSDPKLLIMDEPFSGIDPSRRENLFPYLEKLKDHLGIPIIYISHQMDEIIRLAENVLLMKDGKQKAFGTLEKVLSNQAFEDFIGYSDTGALLRANVSNNGTQLNHLKVEGGELISVSKNLIEGQEVRIRILARDVSLSLSKPKGLSIQNILPSRIKSIKDAGENEVDVRLELTENKTDNPDIIISRITKTSNASLKLKEGKDVFALIKALAITGG